MGHSGGQSQTRGPDWCGVASAPHESGAVHVPVSLLRPALKGALLLQRGRLSPDRHAAVAHAARLRLQGPEARAEAAVDRLRARWAASEDVFTMQDYGAGTREGVLAAEAKPRQRAVADLYRRAAAPPAWGRFLFGLARALKPRRVLELGTNLGVGAAHLQAALALNAAEDASEPRLITIEGDPTLAGWAEEALKTVPAPPLQTAVVPGRFADVLPDTLAAHGPFSLVVLDGHHEEAATNQYVDAVWPHLEPGACLVFDDVEPGRPVRRAFRDRFVTERENGAQAVALVKLGLLFVADPGAQKMQAHAHDSPPHHR